MGEKNPLNNEMMMMARKFLFPRRVRPLITAQTSLSNALIEVSKKSRNICIQRYFSTSEVLEDKEVADTTDDDCYLDTVTMANVYTSIPSGPIDYKRGWAWQQILLNQKIMQQQKRSNDNEKDEILILEHKPVYTLGRGADESNLIFLRDNPKEQERLARRHRDSRLLMDKQMEKRVKNRLLQSSSSIQDSIDALSNNIVPNPVIAPNGAPIYRIERGGEVTYHGPGQLVVYPMLDLQLNNNDGRRKKDLHWYLRSIEEVVIRILEFYDIEGVRDERNTGVWHSDKKIAAVGVSASRWITTHGFALNVSPDLKFFDTSNIFPCGIEDGGVTSIQEILWDRGSETDIPTTTDIAHTALRIIEDVFHLKASIPKVIK